MSRYKRICSNGGNGKNPRAQPSQRERVNRETYLNELEQINGNATLRVQRSFLYIHLQTYKTISVPCTYKGSYMYNYVRYKRQENSELTMLHF